jgi:hypothetical protein
MKILRLRWADVHRIPRRNIVEHDAGVPDDSGKQIVKVVRNSSRKQAETLQFLGLLKTLLEAFPLTHIAQKHGNTVSAGAGADFKPGIQRLMIMLELYRRVLGPGTLQLRALPAAHSAGDQILQLFPKQLRSRNTSQDNAFFIHIGASPFTIESEKTFVDTFQDVADLLGRFDQRHVRIFE